MTLFTLLLIAATASEATPGLPWVATTAPTPEVAPVRYDTPAATAPATAAAPKPAPLALFDKPTTDPAGRQPTQPAANADTFAQRITALNLALSATVINEPTRWSFQELEAEARALTAIASTPAERAEVQAITGRLNQFSSLATRLRRNRATADGWRRPNEAPLAAATRLAPPVRLTKSTSSQHDAEGTLRPVVSKRPNAPKYAVVNPEGQIAALVTPTADTEKQLKKLVGKRVGLQGRRGFLTDLRREHVVAERVTPLDAQRR